MTVRIWPDQRIAIRERGVNVGAFIRAALDYYLGLQEGAEKRKEDEAQRRSTIEGALAYFREQEEVRRKAAEIREKALERFKAKFLAWATERHDLGTQRLGDYGIMLGWVRDHIRQVPALRNMRAEDLLDHCLGTPPEGDP